MSLKFDGVAVYLIVTTGTYEVLVTGYSIRNLRIRTGYNKHNQMKFIYFHGLDNFHLINGKVLSRFLF